jgi:hypothetical protein
LCIDPDHLEVMTDRENILKGNGRAAHQAAQTHCVHGHSTPLEWNGWQRICRICRREYQARLRAKERAAAAA